LHRKCGRTDLSTARQLHLPDGHWVACRGMQGGPAADDGHVIHVMLDGICPPFGKGRVIWQARWHTSPVRADSGPAVRGSAILADGLAPKGDSSCRLRVGISVNLVEAPPAVKEW
jgi:hypothetical protein